MQRVGGADVDGTDGRVAEDCFGADRAPGKRGAQLVCSGGVAAGDGGDFDVLDAAQGFEMYAAHKYRAEDGGADWFGHGDLAFLALGEVLMLDKRSLRG